MNALEILVSPESLHKGARSITGQCAVRAGGEVFPEREWSDFVVVVLGWWLRALAAAEAGEAAELSFMDGPYRVRVEPINGGAARLEFVHERLSGTTSEAQATVSLRQALEACQLAASTVLDACHERGWSGPEVEELGDLVGSARSA
jgi:hypothetical protein